MSLTVEALRAWLDNGNVVAFCYALEEGEIPKPHRHTPDAYRVLYGGELLDDLSRHPNRRITAGGYTSTAAGRFQALWGTWKDFCEAIGESPETLPFTQEWQDLFGIWCLHRRHALGSIAAGKIEEAVAKCALEWASLPGSPYGQPTITMNQFLGAYTGAGGTIDNTELLTPTPAPAEPVAPAMTEVTPSTGRVPQPESPKESPMPIPAIILGLIQAAASVLPVIAQIKGDKSQSSATQNVAVAGKILDVVATTVGAVNQQQAVEIVQQDPAARQKADEAIRAQFFDLLKYAQEQETIAWERTEKSVGDARSFAEKMLWRLAELATTDQTTRGLIVGAAIAMLGQVVSYFFGSSSSSRQSGEALRNIAQGKQP
ncbi:MAG: glycoside hydrolase family 104 protein [Anaerolineae bacterium]|nr:glycoside hydrolase family 104 protein [Anaerolineae bacterium]